jgi:hypothetical protein
LALAVWRRRRGSGQAGGRLGRLVKKGGRRGDLRCTVWLHNISARSPSCGDKPAPPDSPNADLPANRTPRPGLRRSCLVGGLFSLLPPPWQCRSGIPAPMALNTVPLSGSRAKRCCVGPLSNRPWQSLPEGRDIETSAIARVPWKAHRALQGDGVEICPCLAPGPEPAGRFIFIKPSFEVGLISFAP